MAAIINVTEDGKVTKEIMRDGSGAQPKKGDKVEVHDVGTLQSDGSQFDSSRDRTEPFSFKVGKGVIEGWSLGIVTMKVGELAKFAIDPQYGYGDAGSGEKIPGGATLVFEIELLRILPSYKNDDDAIAAVNELCAKAAAAFKTRDFAAALAAYEEAQSILKSKWDDKFDDLKLGVDMTANEGDWNFLNMRISHAQQLGAGSIEPELAGSTPGRGNFVCFVFSYCLGTTRANKTETQCQLDLGEGMLLACRKSRISVRALEDLSGKCTDPDCSILWLPEPAG
jgi:hypothetical protein